MLQIHDGSPTIYKELLFSFLGAMAHTISFTGILTRLETRKFNNGLVLSPFSYRSGPAKSYTYVLLYYQEH
jgi:hypothetical protein